MGYFTTGGNGYESTYCQGSQATCWPYVKDITFPRTFAKAPNVQVMLGNVDTDHSTNTRVYTGAQLVSKTGFKARIATCCGSNLYHVRLVWIACGEWPQLVNYREKKPWFFFV